jgi:hypothetical protein
MPENPSAWWRRHRAESEPSTPPEYHDALTQHTAAETDSEPARTSPAHTADAWMPVSDSAAEALTGAATDPDVDEPHADIDAEASQPPRLVDRHLTFGPVAKLQPAPVRLAGQGMRHLEHVPDTVMDWVETAMGSVRAVSTRGRMHRYLGEVRQDSFALAEGEGYLMLAVADGVGNEAAGHVGSAIAARTAAHSRRLIAAALEHGAEPGFIDLENLRTTLEAVATDRGLPASTTSTTLVVALVRQPDPGTDKTVVTLIQLGDSPAWRVRQGIWERLGPQLATDDGGVLTTDVAALPLHTEARIWTETFESGHTLALTSDGIGNILDANPQYASSLGLLWREAAPAPSDLLQVVDATVKTFEDDRTLVAVRFPDGSQ